MKRRLLLSPSFVAYSRMFFFLESRSCVSQGCLEFIILLPYFPHLYILQPFYIFGPSLDHLMCFRDWGVLCCSGTLLGSYLLTSRWSVVFIDMSLT